MFRLLPIVVLFTMAIDTSAFAQDPYDALSDQEIDRLAELLDSVETAESQGDFHTAFDGYTGMLEMLPEDIYFRLGQAVCLVELGIFEQAEAVLLGLLSSDDLEVAARAELWRARIPTEASVQISGVPLGAQVWVDDTFIAAVGLEYEAVLEVPGEYQIEVIAEGYAPYSVVLITAPRGSYELEAQLVLLSEFQDENSAAVVRVVEPSETEGVPRRIAPVTVSLTALGVLSGVVGIAAWSSANQLEEEFDSYDPQADGATRVARDELRSRSDVRFRVANYTGAISAALLVGSVASYLWVHEDRPVVALVPLPNAGAAIVFGVVW